MKKIQKILILLIFAFVLLIICKANGVEAASASITPSKTVTQGSSVTVTGSVSAGAWNMTLSGAGQSKTLVGQTSIAGNQSASTSITFTASNIGTYNFSFSGDISDFTTDATTYPRNSCTITVVAASSGNTGNNGGTSSGGGSTGGNTNTVAAPMLSNLGINPHDFSGFSPSKTSYSVNVPNDCTSINLYASSKNGTVSGTGQKTLKEGTNKFSVIVSNSSGSKTYTVSVIRATAEGEDVPNVIDGEIENPNENQGIGLSTLEIPGFTLEPEFKIDLYEYTVKTDKELTLEELIEIKDKIIMVANNENVSVEPTPTISEDGTRTITIVVKDAEREYAKYVITFVLEEEDEAPVLAPLTNISNNDDNTGLFGLDPDKQVKVLIGCYLITILFTIGFAVFSIIQTIRLRANSSESNESDEINLDEEYIEEEMTFEPKSNFILNNNEEARMVELKEDKTNPKELVATTVSKLERLDGYRNPRRKRSTSGRHF